MLDDLKMIHERDAQDALGIAEKQWQQLEHQYEIPELPFTGLQNIVFAGMGGSALWALLSQTWPGYKLPFEVWRNYDLPAYVGPATLVIVSSYSGNTEETISALEEAEKRGAKVVVNSSGGKLQELAGAKGLPFVLLPKTTQPRFGALYGLKALVSILERLALVAGGTQGQLQASASFLHENVRVWLPAVPTKDNFAKQMALECVGKSMVIYAGPKLAPAAYKWKISFNENAKNVAWWNQYPEFNHNEFLGWTSHPVEKPYTVIDLRSKLEHPRVQTRFAVSERLLSGQRPAPHVVEAHGETILEQLLWTVALGDFVSLYTALLNGLNPTPVDLIEKFKGALNG